jgi:IS30 family transposase
MVERTSRYYLGVKLSQVAAAPTLQAQLGVYLALPAHAVKSVTADNGSEFAHHYMLADTIGVPTYFADLSSVEFGRGFCYRVSRRTGWGFVAQ